MRVRKTIKKIASIGAAVGMVGATLMGAATAADLAEYPGLFLQDGTFNGLLVVGADAKAEDVIGITNIATSLQSVSVKRTLIPTASTDSTTSVEEGVELCNRDFYVGQNLSACEPSLDDSDLDLLADEVFHDSEGDFDNDEKYTQQLYFDNQATGDFTFTQDDRDAPVANTYFFIDNSDKRIYNYTLNFDSYVSYQNDTSANAGDDLEGTTIYIQGNPFTITDVKVGTSNELYDISEMELQSGEHVLWMSEGETLTRVVDGTEHTIQLIDVTSDATEAAGSCGFKVDGTSVWIDVRDTETVNGVTLGVTDAKRINIEAADQDVCEVAIGAGEITLRHNDEIRFNNDDVDGTLALFTETAGAGTTEGRWTGFTVSWAPEDDEIYMAPGDEFVDPVFGNWKFVFAGVVTGGLETIEFIVGSSSGTLRFKNEDGRQVEIPLAADQSKDTREANNELVYLGDDAPSNTVTNADELLYLEGETCTATTDVTDCVGAMFLVVEATKNEAHLVRITDIDTVDNEIDFDDLTYGTSDDDVSYTDAFDTVFNLKSAGSITLNITENANGGNVIFTSLGGSEDGGTIRTLNRGTITIRNNNAANQSYEGWNFTEYNDGDLVAPATYLTNMRIYAFYDDATDNTIELNYSNATGQDLAAANGYGWFDESSDNDDFIKFYTHKGSLITYDREDQQSLIIEHPYDTVYAQVYVAPTEASTSAVDAGQAYTEEVQQISVGAVKLDSEVADPMGVNLIAVGGPCANSVVAELMGNPADCSTALGITSGQALIKLFENGEYVALVVAGQDAMDTRLASHILSNHEDYGLSGDEMIATTVSESSLSVSAV